MSRALKILEAGKWKSGAPKSDPTYDDLDFVEVTVQFEWQQSAYVTLKVPGKKAHDRNYIENQVGRAQDKWKKTEGSDIDIDWHGMAVSTRGSKDMRKDE